jgi:hypothetical protein
MVGLPDPNEAMTFTPPEPETIAEPAPEKAKEPASVNDQDKKDA